MTKLRVVTWNAEGMFVKGSKTRRATPHDALTVLRRLDADIVVVPEFGNLENLHDEIALAIRSLGYELLLAPYDDERAHGLGIAVLSRLPVVSSRQHRLTETNRSCIEVYYRDKEGETLRVVGVHLDDRSEKIRMSQVRVVTAIIGAQPTVPTLLMGDFNAMHHTSLFARVARSSIAGYVAKHIPHKIVSSIASRVHEMGYGTTITYLIAHTDLRDLDTKHRRTISAKQAGLEWAPATKLAKIDWIFGSKRFETIRYRVLPDVGSDHRPVVADLHY